MENNNSPFIEIKGQLIARALVDALRQAGVNLETDQVSSTDIAEIALRGGNTGNVGAVIQDPDALSGGVSEPGDMGQSRIRDAMEITPSELEARRSGVKKAQPIGERIKSIINGEEDRSTDSQIYTAI